MKLSAKGRFACPPVLPEPAERVSVAIAAWPRVHARTHWRLGDETTVDGADFYVGDEELGHIHLFAEAHVATGIELRKALVGDALALPFRWSSKFVVHTIARAVDVAHALWLFQLAYDRVTGTTEAELVGRVAAYTRRAHGPLRS